MAAPLRPGTDGLLRRGIRRAALVVALGLAAVVLMAGSASALLTGVDVASYQHPGGAPIDWQAVRDAGHSFAFIKATENANYTNPYFAADWTAAGNAGLYRGAYHFARPALPLSTAVDQARYFVSRTGSMTGPLDLPGVLDLETTGGLGQSDLAAWTRSWLAEVQRLTGKAPIVYVGYYFWRDNVGNPSDIGANYRLWLPSYPSDPNSTTFRPLVPAGWSTWTFWQYTSTGTVPGIPGSVDVNRYCCDAGNLAALGGSGAGAGNPFGNLESASRIPGYVAVQGWTIDPDTTGSIAVHVYVDGVWAAQATANVARPDVAAAYPGWTAAHGYDLRVPVGPGEHKVCAYAINTGSGTTNPLLGCQTVVGNPIGSLDAATSPATGQLTASGWALDPDTSSSIPVDLYVDGVMVGRTATGASRPDVAQAFATGTNNGFTTTLAGVPTGSHEICAYAINVGSGTSNPELGCRTVAVGGGDPTGNFEKADPTFGGVRLQGWALDVDSSSPVAVHVYVDGNWATAVTADVARSDVGSAFPLMGARHGFALDLRVASGTHSVCAYAINVGAGATNPKIGCQSVTVSAAPIGNFEDAGRLYDIIVVKGWTIDPDTGAPLAVKVRIDGVDVQAGTADQSRPDVGAAYPVYGGAHGFQQVVFTTPGPHTVCVVAVNAGAGSQDTNLGCRSL
jgi:GH25 family lysozyme M1 (1,4-beta-N-acetylmuramidase)